MKFYTGVSHIKYSWDQVATGFWQRYPNPYSSHVLTEDTISQSSRGSKLFSKKLLTKTNSMPRWGERFVPGPRYVCVLEESVVDPKTKTLTTYTRNIGYTSIMMVEEKCIYRPNPENSDWTECHREAWISSSLYGFSYALQTFGYERFKKNVSRSLKGFNFALHRLFGIEPLDQPLLQVKAEQLKNKAKVATELASTIVARN
jgi:hypothetical protein